MLFEMPALGEPEDRVLAEIEELRTQLRYQLGSKPHRWTGSLRRMTVARNLQGSNSIEGFVASLDDAAAIAVGEQPVEASGETSQALAGYRQAMTYILQLSKTPGRAITEDSLRALHFMLTGYDMRLRPGLYRTGPIYVTAEGTGRPVYTGPDPELVPALMGELVQSLEDTTGPALVRAAMAHLNLVKIQPFRDGNGRLARCLQSLVIAAGGEEYSAFLSIEEYLGAHTLTYYQVLAEAGGPTWTPDSDARGWVRFMLTAHWRQVRTMRHRAEQSAYAWGELEELVARRGFPDRVVSLLYDAAFGLTVRMAIYRALLEDAEVSEQTATRDLRRLVDAGLLQPHSAGVGRYYRAGDALAGLRNTLAVDAASAETTDPFAPHHEA